MTTTVQHAVYGEITYEENFWTGKRTIQIDGVDLQKLRKNLYLYERGGEKVEVAVQGSFVYGMKLVIGNERIQVTKAAKWYEIACTIVMFVFVLAWGSSSALCSIVPIVGGAIGGLIGGVMVVFNLLAMKSVDRVGVKLAIWAGMFAADFGACFLVAQILLAL